MEAKSIPPAPPIPPIPPPGGYCGQSRSRNEGGKKGSKVRKEVIQPENGPRGEKTHALRFSFSFWLFVLLFILILPLAEVSLRFEKEGEVSIRSSRYKNQSRGVVGQGKEQKKKEKKGKTNFEEVDLDLVLCQPGPVIFTSFLLLQDQSQVLSVQDSLDFLDFGKQVQVEFELFGVDFGGGSCWCWWSTVTFERDVGRSDG